MSEKLNANFILGLFSIVMIVMYTSCENEMNQSDNIKKALEEYRNIYSPDTRVVYWNVDINFDKGQKKVLIETDNEAIKKENFVKFKEEFPGIEINVKILPEKYLGDKIYGLITISAGSMRSTPRHSAELVTQALLGTPVKVLKKKGGWYLIQTPDNYLGWIDSPGLSLKNKKEIGTWIKSTRKVCVEQSANIYADKTKKVIISDIVLGNIIEITDSLPEIYELKFPDGRKGYAEKKIFIPVEVLISQKEIDTTMLVNLSRKFMGLPYMWGSNSSKFTDCSGFTKLLYFMNGFILQRDASQQTHYGTLINTQNGFSGLEAGDLLFFGRKANDSLPEKVTHVGMYIGNTEFIHASGLVKINSLDPSRINFDPGYIENFIRVRRLKGLEGNPGIERIESNIFYKGFEF